MSTDETVDYNDYTIAELKELLDEAEIEYQNNQLKAYYVELAETHLEGGMGE